MLRKSQYVPRFCSRKSTFLRTVQKNIESVSFVSLSFFGCCVGGWVREGEGKGC